MKDNKFITICFFTILFGILILYPINFFLVKLDIVTIVNSSNKEPTYKESGFLSSISNFVEKAKTSVDNKVINYFPFYSSMNKMDKDIDSTFNQFIYNKGLNQKYYPMGKNSDGEYIYRNNEHYILQNNLSTKELDDRIKEQITFLNSLDIGEINIFIPYRFEYTNIDNSVYIRDMSKYIKTFKKGVNKNIHIKEFMVNNKDDYLHYFYKTDHHYNMYGAYESYKIIMDMLGEKPKDAQIKKEDVTYYGSLARSTYSKDIKDNFYTLDVKLGKHDILVNGKENSKYKPKKILTNRSSFYDYYVNYFNGLFGRVEYNFHNDSKDNLLILEDSYGWQIDEVIASHYNKTYIIDIRHDEYENGKFYIKDFIKENNIKKVLFIYEAGSIFFDQYDYGLKDKVVS